MIGNVLPSLLRTGVPASVGWLCAWLLARGIQIPADTREWAVSGLTFAILMFYYVAVRALERRFPSAGWLLGYPAKPVYGKVSPRTQRRARVHRKRGGKR